MLKIKTEHQSFTVNDLDSEELAACQKAVAGCNCYFELTAYNVYEHSIHDSLTRILYNFHGIPTPKSASTNQFTWHGPIAKTILMNL